MASASNTVSINANVVKVSSEMKLPVYTGNGMSSIRAPIEGDILYNKDTKGLYYYDGTQFVTIPGGTVPPDIKTYIDTQDANTLILANQYTDDKWNSLGNWQIPVLSYALSPDYGTTPGSRYLIMSGSPDIVWADHPNQIVEYDASGIEQFTIPTDGMIVFAQDTDYIWLYNGTSWVRLSIQIDHNHTLGLQGGSLDQMYHLSQAQYDKQQFLNNVTTDVQTQLNNRIRTDLTTSSQQTVNGYVTHAIDAGNIDITNRNSNPCIAFQNNGATKCADMRLGVNAGDVAFRTGNSVASLTERMRITNAGTVVINNLTANRAVYSDASSQLMPSIVTDVELSNLSGSTSNVQTQLNNRLRTDLALSSTQNVNGVLNVGVPVGKFRLFAPNNQMGIGISNLPGTQNAQIVMDPVSGSLDVKVGISDLSMTSAINVDSNANVAIMNATASRATYFDANKALKSSTTTDVELSYLNGVTSGVQTQLNNKLNLTGGTMTGLLTTNRLTAATPTDVSQWPLVVGNFTDMTSVSQWVTGDKKDTSLFNVTFPNVTATNTDPGVHPPVQIWSRSGIAGKSYGNAAVWTLKKHIYGSSSSATRLSLAITNSDSNQLVEIVQFNYSGVVFPSGNVTSAGNMNGATPTEMSYLSGATSNIQTQLNAITSVVKKAININITNGTISVTKSKGGFGTVAIDGTFPWRLNVPFSTAFASEPYFASSARLYNAALRNFRVEAFVSASQMTFELRNGANGNPVTWGSATDYGEYLLYGMAEL